MDSTSKTTKKQPLPIEDFVTTFPPDSDDEAKEYLEENFSTYSKSFDIIRKSPDIETSEKIIYEELYRLGEAIARTKAVGKRITKHKVTLFPSLESIAEGCGLSETSLHPILRTMEKKGMIRRRRRTGTTTIIQLIPPMEFFTSDYIDAFLDNERIGQGWKNKTLKSGPVKARR